jgi:hypothetical protein
MRYPSSLTGKCAVPAIGAALVLSGCAALKPPTTESKIFERDGISMVVVPSNSRETYFSDPKSMERHCRAPSPDVSLTSSEGVSINVPSPAGGGVGLGEDTSTGALGLGGRSPAVLISRELLYRACELSNNLNLPRDQALKLFQDILAVIVKISTTQTGSGTAAVASATYDPRVQAPNTGPDPTGGAGIFSPGSVPSVFTPAIPGTVPAAGTPPGNQ